MEEYDKIRKQYGSDGSVMLKELTDGSFKFQSPVYEPPVQSCAGVRRTQGDEKEKRRKASKDKPEK